MNRWRVYSTMKQAWIATDGERTNTISELLRIFPDIDDNELQEGIVEFRMMASRCHKEYGFDTDIAECEA